VDRPRHRAVAAAPAAFAVRTGDHADAGIQPAVRAVRRFDAGLTHTPPREWIDYGDLLGLCREQTSRETEVEQAFLRASFNIGAANDDDHGRNHAFLFDPAHGWRLAPAYDLTRAGYPLGSGFRAAGIDGRFSGLAPADLRRLGRDQAVRRIDETIGRVIDTIRRWPEFAAEAGLGETHAAMLAAEMPAARW